MFFKVLKETFQIFFFKINTFITISLLVCFPVNLFINWYSIFYPANLKVISGISRLNDLLYPLLIGTVIHICNCAKTGSNCGPIQGLKRGLTYFWPIVRANAVAGLKVTFGLILLVVPGLIFATQYALINPIVVIEKNILEKPRNHSMEITIGNRWNIFFTGLMLAAGIISVCYLLDSITEPKSIQFSIFWKALKESIFPLLWFLPTISMFLYYWNWKIGNKGKLEKKMAFDPI